MRFKLGCTIKTSVQVNCDLIIGYSIKDSSPYNASWTRFMGQLQLGDGYGNWFYYMPGKSIEGVVLFPDGDARTFGMNDRITTLYKVPNRFLETLAPGRSLAGNGIYHRTGDPITWELWHPFS